MQRSRRYLQCLVLACAVSGVGIRLGAQEEFPFPAPSGELRVVSWNIEFLGARSPRRSGEQVAAIATRIDTLDAAILTLQEISSVALLDALREDLGESWRIYRPNSLNAFLYDTDRVEASSLEVLERLEGVPFTPYTGRASFLPISGVFRPRSAEAQPFRLINVHFHPSSAATRTAEGEWISRKVVELLHTAGEPEDIVVLGDMNGDPAEAPHPALRATNDLVFFEKENGPSTFWSGVAIDHIYTTASLSGAVPKGTAFVVRPKHYGETVEQFEETYSDHFPVFVDICPTCPRRPRADFTVRDLLREFEEVELSAGISTTVEGHKIVSYHWAFGDGATAETETARHAYTERGSFRIRLRVTDDRDLSSEVTRQVPVLLASGEIPPWVSTDVGKPIIQGAARFDGGDLLVSAGGGGLGGSADAFFFLHQDVTGDARLTVRLVDVFRSVPTVGPALLGITLREGLEASSPHVTVALRSPGVTPKLMVRSRTVEGKRNRHVQSDEAPSWLRLERQGDLFLASSSIDGEVWREFEQVELATSLTMRAGLVATANDTAREGVTLFGRVSTLELVGGEAQYARGDCNADARTDIADGIFHLGFLFGDGAAPRCIEACNTNRDAESSVSDAVFLFNYLLRGGSAPENPFPECGSDPQPRLSCDEGVCS
jgi:endonuclease/exonuclease/phosphatase family metal-dependent hydrolase